MALGSKTVKIGKVDVNIIQFNAIEVMTIRKELVHSIKQQVGNIDKSEAGIISALASVLYELDPKMLMNLFQKCSAVGSGALSEEANFLETFNENVDGALELALEVLDYNGFFTRNTISIICKKIPFLAPMEKALLGMMQDLKAKTS